MSLGAEKTASIEGGFEMYFLNKPRVDELP